MERIRCRECTGDHAVCRVVGEIDIATVDRFRRAALDGLDAHGPGVTVDLSKVTFMDCAGLRMLLQVREAAQARGEHAVFVGVPSMLLSLLAVVGLDRVLDWRPVVAGPQEPVA